MLASQTHFRKAGVTMKKWDTTSQNRQTWNRRK